MAGLLLNVRDLLRITAAGIAVFVALLVCITALLVARSVERSYNFATGR